MPIKTLAERRRYMRLGKIRLGIQVPYKDKKTGEEKTRPSATDYFVVKEEIEGAGADVLRRYGAEPRELNMRFLFDDERLTFPQWLKLYRGDGMLRCMGDGEFIVHRRYFDEDNEVDQVVVSNGVVSWGSLEPLAEDILQTWAEQYGVGRVLGGMAPLQPGEHETGDAVECLADRCPQYGPKGCRPTGRLLFMVEGVDRLGFWEMVVHQHDIVGINSQLELCRAFTAQYLGRPTILHVPFKLRLTGPTEMKVPGYDGKIKKYTPEIEPDPYWISEVVAKRVQLPEIEAPEDGDVWDVEAKPELPEPFEPAPEEEEPLDYDPTQDFEEVGPDEALQDWHNKVKAYAKLKKISQPAVDEAYAHGQGDPEKALIELKQLCGDI